ncbi:hypothetical protein CANCADRAFT_95592 [Tortispora caseinolytica NRRL Y-17796]|uniref:Methyltransferase domain-containing protein n=1 Tax=Tortispora caseinolytica NRRL Y-17796 TaxID=767744 RepID=A0A1E4TMG7_9ASCO|nr:hypothetical protein CANCADRAFT_95592 [Tortispora caseinolytica NRRL Y-17796]
MFLISFLSLLIVHVKTILLFSYGCFVKPLIGGSSSKGSYNQQQMLESFYSVQADIYDASRARLLKGREDMLRILASHLQQKRDLIWIDIGAGTGLNADSMNKILPLKTHFKAVYLVDLSPSLCQVAQRKYRHYDNVHIICADACSFSIDDFEQTSAHLITFAYSISMIPAFYAAIEHALLNFLHPSGMLGVVDFGVQKPSNAIDRVDVVGGMRNRAQNWIMRTFWYTWFDIDNVHLDPARRDYLEYRCGTIKSLNCKNHFWYGINIPYYIWIGTQARTNPELLWRLNSLACESPYLAPPSELDSSSTQNNSLIPVSKGLEAAQRNQERGLPYPSLFYQKEVWRVYYDELDPLNRQFKDQYIYAFTWEDPREDQAILNMNSNDVVLAITSGGDNLLDYALIPNPPRRIHGVDLNPCQGHLAELKLAALRSLSYDQVWSLFGAGKSEEFRDLLLDKLSPHLSSQAMQYWFENGPSFFHNDGLYYQSGNTRWALKLCRAVAKYTGMEDNIDRLCSCETLEEQKMLWQETIRPMLFNKVVTRLIISNPIFLWKAAGVPMNQADLIDSSLLQYIIDTLDPVIERSLVSKDNYFYYLTLKGHYAHDNCPNYLKEESYDTLHKEDSPLDRIRLHTDTLVNVSERLASKSLSIAIIMDHMDWFHPKGQDAISEIKALYSALRPSGCVMLRSASTKPWYIETFEENGFKCEAAAVRLPGESIDRVNMYASTWLCKKPETGESRISSISLADSS